jgi:hypothetical protein
MEFRQIHDDWHYHMGLLVLGIQKRMRAQVFLLHNEHWNILKFMSLHSSHSVLNGAWIENIPFLSLTLRAMSKRVHSSQWVVLYSRLKMTMSHCRILYSGPSDKVMPLNNKILQTDMNIDKSKIVHPQTYQVWVLIHTSSIKCMSTIWTQIIVYFN